MLDTTFWGRVDSPTAQNGELLLVNNTASIEFTFVKYDDPLTQAVEGDLQLESPGQIDPDTKVVIDGVEYSFRYEFVGTLPTNNKVPPEFQGDQAIVITIIGLPSANSPDTRLMFLPGQNASEADMDRFGNGSIPLELPDPLQPPPPPPPICFGSGTQVETPTGPVRVNDLKAGDLVCTADGGPQPLVWVTSSHHVWPGSDDRHKPVLISAGALGKNTPSHDLIVSPQHHIAFRGAVCRELFDEETILAPAKGLTGLRGIRVMAGKTEAEYFHLMLSEHAVLMTHGVGTESFYPGPTAIRMMDKAQRDSLYEILPNLHAGVEVGYGLPAHKKITVRQAELLVRRLGKNPDQGRMPVAVGKSLENV